MIIHKLLLSMLVWMTLLLSACHAEAGVKLDATDGITLDGTFQEAVEGLVD